MRQHYVYQTTNLINAKQYVGYHFGELDDGYLGSGTIIQQALKKYGKENFEKEILYVSKSQYIAKDVMEPFYISLLKPRYNIAEGGEGGDPTKYMSPERKAEIRKNSSEKMKIYYSNPENRKKRSEENMGRKPTLQARKNMSEAVKGEKNHFFGEKHKQETKDKISEKLKGHKKSDETLKKMSESRKGEKNHFFGEKHKQETKDKISEKLKGYKQSEAHRRASGAAKKKYWAEKRNDQMFYYLYLTAITKEEV